MSREGEDTEAIFVPLVANGTPKHKQIKEHSPSVNIDATTETKEDENRVTLKQRLIKYGALILLVIQNVGLVLLMRYSRTQHASATTAREKEEHLYLPSTAVFFNEVLKLIICSMITLIQFDWNVALMIQAIWVPMDILKLAVPSVLYTIQNNLLYIALTYLDASSFQVCIQLKILTTALFSSLMLQRRFSKLKWTSLVLLTLGVIVSELPKKRGETEGEVKVAVAYFDKLFGLMAVIGAACSSGFTGVYFEKILKESPTSLWIRNIQMGISAVVAANMASYAKDREAIQQFGYLGGYNTVVWMVIVVQALGGLIVATVIKYADNVLKVYATSLSIVLSCIISAIFFDFHPSGSFVLGATIVVGATIMYSIPERAGGSSPTTELHNDSSEVESVVQFDDPVKNV